MTRMLRAIVVALGVSGRVRGKYPAVGSGLFSGSDYPVGSASFIKYADYRYGFHSRLISLFEMLRFHAEYFVQLSRAFAALLEHPSTRELVDAERIMGEENRSWLADKLAETRGMCERVNLNLCVIQIRRMLIELNDPGLTYRKFTESAKELQNRMIDELALGLYLQVEANKTDYYRQKEPLFGQDVNDKCPSAISNIEEAGKCLALGRDTASVYHLMRVMEVGLKTLAKALGIPYAPSWESYLQQINTKITVKHKKKGIKWKKDEPFFREVAGDLLTVKIAWRNPTMHIVRNYSPGEAEEILNAVKSFMKHLVTRFSESV